MGLSAGQYSMQCWHSTENSDAISRPKLLCQSFRLIHALQKRFSNSEIAIPSTENKDKKGIEICILYRAGASLFADIAHFLTDTAASLSLDYQKFVKQDAGLTRYFDQNEIENISLLARPVPDNLTEQSVAQYIEHAAKFESNYTNDGWRQSITAGQLALPFQITRNQLNRFKNKEGNQLAEEIQSVMHGLTTANTKSKSAFALITMVAKGVVPIVGGWAVVGAAATGTANMSITFILIMWNAGFVGAAIVASTAVLAAAVTLSAGPYLMLKDASNVLLLMNDSPNDVLPKMEWIENGERRVVPEVIPAAPPNSDFVSCGLFFYSKYQVKSFAVGTYGSAFGVSFLTGNSSFSIGMDCPNSLMGGNNSIEVHNHEHAHEACQMALGSGCMHGWIADPPVDVKIADHWGNVNWGRAIVAKK